MDSTKPTKGSTDVDSSETQRDFSSLQIHELILKWLYHKNIKLMTRVQSLSIDKFLKKGNDLLVQSCTGSGKTLCFVIPILHTYLHDNNYEFKNLLDVFSLIILPTRELAIQVFNILVDSLIFIENKGFIDNVSTKTKHTFTVMDKNLYCSLIIGGTTVDNDVRFLTESKDRGYVKSFIIATPGRLSRLMQLLEHEFVWTFKNLSFLILDEADRFLEMGYQNDMSKIFTYLPKQRKTGLFSATLSSGVQTLSKLCLSNQIFINADDKYNSCNILQNMPNEHSGVTNYTTPKKLNNYYLVLNTQEKLHFSLLFIQYLKRVRARKLVIFLLSCDLVDYFYDVFVRLSSSSEPLEFDTLSSKNQKSGINFYKIHRKMTTKKRNKSINSFRSNSEEPLSVLLCTDIFSRGIDIPKIDWILQFDPPQDPNFYLHRIGRASRADNVGNALLLLTQNEESYIQFQINRKINLIQLPPDVLDELKVVCNDLDCNKEEQKNNKSNSNIPFVLKDIEVRNDTKVMENVNYFEYLKMNPVKDPVLNWKRTCIILAYIRLINSKNRDLLLSSSRAFVSYTRAYSEHSLKYIFEKNKLDYGALATSLGVLRIPRVKEILGKKISNFVQSSTNPSDVPFLDQEKEANRIKLLNELKEEKNQDDNKKDKNKDKKPKKLNRTRSEKREAKRKSTYDEWNEFRREEAYVKKLKKKGFEQKNVEKITDDEDLEKIEDMNDEFDELDGELDIFNSENIDSKSMKKWITRGKKRKKRR